MKYLLLIVMVMLSACSTSKYRMKNCSPVGEVGGDHLFDCEAYHEPKNVREAR